MKNNDLDEFGYYLAIAETLLENKDAENALDLGCNSGFLVKAFHHLGIEAFGCDISDEALSKSPQDVKEYLRLLDITHDELPYENESFDIITMIDVIEHLETFNWTLKELKRVLKRDGLVYISTPSPFTALFGDDPTHVNVHFRRFWIDLFEDHGFNYGGDFPKKQRKIALSYLKHGKTVSFISKINSLSFIPDLRSDLFFAKIK